MTDRYLLLIFIANGLIWIKSNLSKLPPDRFIDSLSVTLERFASKNPYPPVKNFLENIAIPNSQTFGFLTFWGELLVGLAIIPASLYLLFKPSKNKFIPAILLLGFLGGMFLNAIFWLSSGWTSPSTDSINLLMFFVEIIGAVYMFNFIRR